MPSVVTLHPRIVRRVGVHARATMIDGFGAQFVVPGLVAVDLAQPVLRHRAGPATPRPRRARCRPRPPTREQTCRGWPPIGQLALPSRTSRPLRRVGAPGTPANASHYRRRARFRRPRHPSRPGAGHGGEPDRAWPHPEPRRRRPSCLWGRHRQPRRADHGARCGGRRCSKQPSWTEGGRWVMRPSTTRTRATGSRGLRRSPRRRPAGRRHGSSESESHGSLFVPVPGMACLHSRQRGVASTYPVFDMTTICAGPSIGACAC